LAAPRFVSVAAVIVGVDTGGTFTDAVADDGRIAKVLSTSRDLGGAVRSAVTELSPSRRTDGLAHGTTVATNALLERRGAVVALVTNEGFADVIEIARQDRPSLYDPFADRPEPLVPRRLRYEVRGRLAADGTELVPIGTAPAIDASVEAVAVCLFHADLNPTHEQAVADELRRSGVDVTASHEVSPEFREYERTLTTVVNAYLRPVCRAYLRDIGAVADEVLVMTSAGGLIPIDEGAELPASLLLSGPAGGVRAGAETALANGFADAVTFDMGGTSTDVCLVQGGVPEPAPGRVVGGFPIRLPSLDVHTIGAGGGSIASIDPGGALVVGPESAGADPGPACYGRGGERPTVTDANLVAGRIPADAELPELGRLELDAAVKALDRAGVTADGVLQVVNANMGRALRAVSVERGVDPRRLALVAFGGAGPLHACDLADALGMPAVVVPARAGVLSAVGLACSPRQREIVRSWPTPVDHAGVDEALRAVAAEAAGLVGSGATVATFVDCRYAGQSHELTVARVDDFHDEHRRRNGYARPDAPVEVVVLRARARLDAPLRLADLPVVERQPAVGPAVIAEPDCTIVVADGWRAEVGEAGALVLRRGG
jgi:N-methylhydantoinase A/oxoprolinase/acetone carboxylase beta subunit